MPKCLGHLFMSRSCRNASFLMVTYSILCMYFSLLVLYWRAKTEGRDLCLSCSMIYPKHLKHCWAHSEHQQIFVEWVINIWVISGFSLFQQRFKEYFSKGTPLPVLTCLFWTRMDNSQHSLNWGMECTSCWGTASESPCTGPGEPQRHSSLWCWKSIHILKQILMCHDYYYFLPKTS